MENPSPPTGIFIDVDALIKFVESRTVLWQPTESAANSKKTRDERNEVWLELCKTMYRGPDFDSLTQEQKDEFVKEVKNKWNNIKNAFYKSRRKRSDSAPEDCLKTSRGKYANDDRLEFLSALISSPREPESAPNTTLDVDLSTRIANLSVESEADAVFASADPPVTSNHRNEGASGGVAPVFSSTTFNRHLLFFHSILPSLDEFTDDETIRFQNAVSQAILDIKNAKRARPPASNRRKSHLMQSSSPLDSTPASGIYLRSIFCPNESALSTAGSVNVVKSSKGQPVEVSSSNESDSTIED